MNCEITDYSNVLMPFGKYKGKTIEDIADIKSSNGFEKGKDYLRWLLENISLKSQILQEAIEHYLDE